MTISIHNNGIKDDKNASTMMAVNNREQFNNRGKYFLNNKIYEVHGYQIFDLIL